MDVRIRLLGGFEVDIDGGTVPAAEWRRRASANVVKILALQPGRRLLRDQLIDALWPDLLVDEALPRLHKATHHARRALGDRDSISTDGAALQLWPRVDVHVDVVAFEEAVATARTGGAVEAARAAAALYGGDLLPDDLYEPWTDEARSRLRLWWIEMLQAAGMYEELVAASPLDEDTHLALVRHYVETGRRQPALGALDRMAVLLQQELGVGPGPEAEELRRLAEELPLATPSSAGSARAQRPLPAARSRLVGRDVDLHAVGDLLARHRIVTLTGPGGAGKSTLALAAARAAIERGGDAVDVVFAELASARDAADVTRVVAEVAGVEGQGAVDVVALTAALGRRGTSLVVLDNCEHLIEASAELVDVLLDATPAVRVLATSREPLRVEGEVEHRIGSLGAAAVELFVERATAVRPGAVDDDDQAAAELCARLDGLPLAIELAAAQLRYLSLAEIVERLDDRLHLLVGGRSRAGERHSALHATIDWSYQLLEAGARELFERLGVFPAGFDLDAALAVSASDRLSVTRQMGELVQKSLVVYDADHGRYRLLETVRLFASEHLEPARRQDAAERLRSHVVRRATEVPRPQAWLSTSLSARSRDDLDNVRWAFELSLECGALTDAVDIAIGLSTLWRNATSYAEGRRWVADLEQRTLAPGDRLWVEILGADIGLGAGDPTAMRSHADAAADLVDKAEDGGGAVIAGIYHAIVHLGDIVRAAERLAEVAGAAQDIGEDGLARLARGYRLVVLQLGGVSGDVRAEAHELTDGQSTRDYALYLCRWAASLTALVDRDGPWLDALMAAQRDDLAASGLHENWLTMYWGALMSIVTGRDHVHELARARARASAEGRGADADCVLALAYAAACRDDWEGAAELVGATEGALLHDTAGYFHQAIVRDRLVRPRLAPDTYAECVARGRRLALHQIVSDHGL